jgi:transposase
MLRFNPEAQIYLRTGATDMRKSINGLSGLVQNEMGLNPFKPGYFVFCNKTRHLMKLLYWDRTGFAIWYKRLEKDKFPWPEDESDAQGISAKQMYWLLDGIDFFKAHKKLQFSVV